jgi:ferredoxin-NADP reductase
MARALRRTDYGLEFIAKVLASQPLTPSAHGITVERPPEFHFAPVQFTFLSLRTPESQDWSDYRPMSLASSPTRPHLEYGVRTGLTPWKHAFAALRPGDEVMVEGPRGRFLLDPQRPAVLVAGGIGITPLKGMVEYATDARLPIPLRLLYSNRTEAEIAYRPELDALAAANPNLRVEHT